MQTHSMTTPPASLESAKAALLKMAGGLSTRLEEGKTVPESSAPPCSPEAAASPQRSSSSTVNAIAQDAMNVGVVARVTSLRAFEAAAGRIGTKGAILDRRQHELEAAMHTWVNAQDEPMESFATVEVLHPAAGDEADACKRLTAGLPDAFRDVVCSDAEALCTMLLRRCPAASCLALNIEIIGANGCGRWHEDNYIGRMIITYSGPGTWMVDDASVRYDQFAATRGEPNHMSDIRIVPSFDSIHEAPANAIALIKGKEWPGLVGNGLIHKSPNVPYVNGRLALQRLLLKVDLANKTLLRID